MSRRALPSTTEASDPTGLRTAAAVMLWISVVLLVDTAGSLSVQRVLGVLTWVVLFAVLRRETAPVRTQTAIVVAFATAVEFVFSPLLGVYLYRLGNVPAYVPPGHGLVYLAALSIGRSTWTRLRRRGLTTAVVVVGGCWALYGVTLAPRPDQLGAFWFCCLAVFLICGPSRELYVGAFVVVSYLELLGTSLGAWTWQPRDPVGLVTIGNPPSGASGGYAWFDLAALLGAPALGRLLGLSGPAGGGAEAGPKSPVAM